MTTPKPEEFLRRMLACDPDHLFRRALKCTYASYDALQNLVESLTYFVDARQEFCRDTCDRFQILIDSASHPSTKADLMDRLAMILRNGFPNAIDTVLTQQACTHAASVEAIWNSCAPSELGSGAATIATAGASMLPAVGNAIGAVAATIGWMRRHKSRLNANIAERKAVAGYVRAISRWTDEANRQARLLRENADIFALS